MILIYSKLRQRKMKICLINDTSSCHAGSRKVMENLRHYMKDHEIVATINVNVGGVINREHIDACDLVVVNAEGSIHHNAPWGIAILEALDYAQGSGKKTYLLYALYEKMHSKFDYIIGKCDVVMAREPWSWNILKEINSGAELHPDFCVLNPIEIEPPSVMSGIAKTQTHHAAIYKGCFTNLKYPILSVGHQWSFDQYVSYYKNLDILLTGQHHAVYACMLAGTPFVPTFGNSHKIESFLEWFGLPMMVCASPEQVKTEIKNIQDGKYDQKFKQARTKFYAHIEALDVRLKVIFDV